MFEFLQLSAHLAKVPQETYACLWQVCDDHKDLFPASILTLDSVLIGAHQNQWVCFVNNYHTMLKQLSKANGTVWDSFKE